MDHRSATHPERGSTAAAGGGTEAATRRPARRALAGDDCDIRLTLPARAENVALVRHVVGALAEALAFPPRLVEDIRLAVTEACTNVVRHAYLGTEGRLDVAVTPAPDSLTVVVRDHGRGIQPNPASDGPGLGLPLIAALTDALEIDHAPGSGSRLCMSFSASDGTLQTA